MAKIPVNGGSDFVQPDTGTYTVAIVVAADIGTQPDDVIKGSGPNAGKPVKGGRRIMFNLELLGHDPESEFPTTLLQEVNVSLGEKSKLAALSKAFLGQDKDAFRAATRDGLDLTSFLGKTALGSVGLSSGGRARLESFVGLPKGTKVDAPRSELIVFDIDDASDATLRKLPKLFQDKIAQSEERKEGGDSDVAVKTTTVSSLDL